MVPGPRTTKPHRDGDFYPRKFANKRGSLGENGILNMSGRCTLQKHRTHFLIQSVSRDKDNRESREAHLKLAHGRHPATSRELFTLFAYYNNTGSSNPREAHLYIALPFSSFYKV